MLRLPAKVRRSIAAMILAGAVISLPIAAVQAETAETEATCDFTNRVYRDRDGRGFELEFFPPASDEYIFFAYARFQHPDRGVIFEFDVTASQGYGSTWLVRQDLPDDSYRMVSFSSDLTTDVSNQVPEYVYVEALGSADYYMNQTTGGREIIFGDAIWQFDRCRTDAE